MQYNWQQRISGPYNFGIQWYSNLVYSNALYVAPCSGPRYLSTRWGQQVASSCDSGLFPGTRRSQHVSSEQQWTDTSPAVFTRCRSPNHHFCWKKRVRDLRLDSCQRGARLKAIILSSDCYYSSIMLSKRFRHQETPKNATSPKTERTSLNSTVEQVSFRTYQKPFGKPS